MVSLEPLSAYLMMMVSFLVFRDWIADHSIGGEVICGFEVRFCAYIMAVSVLVR